MGRRFCRVKTPVERKLGIIVLLFQKMMMMQKEERKAERQVILLGVVQEREKIIGSLDTIWRVISSCGRAGDLFIALVICHRFRHSVSCSCSDARVLQREEKQDVVLGTLKCVVGSKGKHMVDQLSELRRRCNLNQIQMDVKLVAGAEKPKKVLAEQANSLGASTLVVNSSCDRFPWSHRGRLNYIVKKAPAGCSVIFVRNGTSTYVKDKKEIATTDNATAAETESSFYAGTDPGGKRIDEFNVECSRNSSVSVCCKETGNIQIQAEQMEEESQVFEISEIHQNGQDYSSSKVSEHWEESKQNLECKVNVSKTNEDCCWEDADADEDVIDVFFDADEDDDEYYENAERKQQSLPCSSNTQVCRDYFELREEESHAAISADAEFNTNTRSEKVAEEGTKNWSTNQSQGDSPRGVLDRLPSSVDSESSCSPTSNSFSDKVNKPSSSSSSPSCQCNNEHAKTPTAVKSIIRKLRTKSQWRLPSFAYPAVSKSSWGGRDVHGRSKRTHSLDHHHHHCGIVDETSLNCTDDGWDMSHFLTNVYSKPSSKLFSLRQLEIATSNFSPDNLIGKGGYAEVYKGCLPDGQIIAIKKLNRSQKREQREHDFLSEIGIIAHIYHPNAARLIGYSTEGGQHIILQFSPHGSLASVLHGPNFQMLSWEIRYRIAVGVARGLNYLHEGCVRRIIHRDIKSANILLTENFEPQISDFGLAKWLPQDTERLTVTPVEGTFGYLAPEYFMHGIVNVKTDVFAFGVLLLELLTGRHPIDSSQQSLVMWAKPMIDKERIRELADPNLGDDYDIEQMTWVASTAGLCVQQCPHLRPAMAQVLRMLAHGRDEMESVENMKSASQPEALDTDEYTSIDYLNDLNRHKQIALQD